MVWQSGVWTEADRWEPGLLREARSGLSGFGGRPTLHPAWRSPDRDEQVDYLLATRLRRRPAPARRSAA